MKKMKKDEKNEDTKLENCPTSPPKKQLRNANIYFGSTFHI